jgi:hypothetical protein
LSVPRVERRGLRLLLQGTSAGWGDTYDWLLPGQYIEVSGVPDGTYILETSADPDNVLQEANDRNNCTAVYVRLSGLTTSSPSAQIVGLGPPARSEHDDGFIVTVGVVRPVSDTLECRSVAVLTEPLEI